MKDFASGRRNPIVSPFSGYPISDLEDVLFDASSTNTNGYRWLLR